MQFVIIARDYTDDEALSRRLAARAEHFKRIRLLTAQGHFLMGGAMLSEKQEGDERQMNGSVLVADFPSREALESMWLVQEPYMTERVWEHVEIIPFNTALLGEPMIQSISEMLSQVAI